MGKDDYAAAGGALKLKGVKGGGIDKKHKKKKKKAEADNSTAIGDTAEHRSEETDDAARPDSREDDERDAQADLRAKQDRVNDAQALLDDMRKTAAEKRHEEMRRRRLDERLRREGVKTHKERVEELNKYLSNLSEHHDMPRIGPG